MSRQAFAQFNAWGKTKKGVYYLHKKSIKMSGGKNKKQLRRCQVCNRPGHNRSTCPERNFVIPSIAEPTEGVSAHKIQNHQPLKFFVHHTTTLPSESEHKLNLKTGMSSVWKGVTSVSPTLPKNQDYYFRSPQFNTPTEVRSEPTITTTPLKNYPGGARTLEILPEQKVGEEILDEAEQEIPKIIETTPINNLLKRKNILEKISDWLREEKEKTKKLFVRTPKVKPLETALISIAPVGGVTPVSDTATPKLTMPRKLVSSFTTKTFKMSLGIVVGLVVVVGLGAYVRSLVIFKNTLQTKGMNGFVSLKNSLKSMSKGDWNGAKIENENALKELSEALTELNTKHRILQNVITSIPYLGQTLTDRQKILLAGQSLALGNEHMLTELGALPENADNSTKFLGLARGAAEAANFYKESVEKLKDIKPSSIPGDYREEFLKNKNLLNLAVTNLNQIKSVAELVPDVFGGEGRRRYLIVFQNPAELRATGGFMGSFAVVEMLNGKMVKLDIPAGGSYDLQGQLSKFVEPPAPLLLSNKRWEFQDANWYPDWPASAQKIAWFYRNSRGVTVDGVIAVNATLLPKILALLGPIEDSKRGVVFGSENVIFDLQNIVERGAEKSVQKPKAVIADLSNALATRVTELSSPAQITALAYILQEALTNKDLQLAFFDSHLSEIVRELGWDGAVAQITPVEDYLMVICSNIQGQKSDARIEQNVSHEAVVDTDGTVNVTVTITRKHTGTEGELDYGVPNISYVRVFVPAGSTLTSAKGFSWPDEKAFRAPLANAVPDADLEKNEKIILTDAESGTQIIQSFNKYVFGNWMITEPQKTSIAILTYRLPFKLPLLAATNKLWKNDPPVSYQLVLQKQSGANSTFDMQIIFPNDWATIWVDGANAVAARNGLTVAPTPLKNDTVYSVLVRHQ